MKKVSLLASWGIVALLTLGLVSCGETAKCPTCEECKECETCEKCEECGVCEECEECTDNGMKVDYQVPGTENYWTGKVNAEGQPEGLGKLIFGGTTEDEDVYDVFYGELNPDWSLKQGKRRYPNLMYYEGDFTHKGDGIGNQGMFVWGQDVYSGNSFRGSILFDGGGGFDNRNQYGTGMSPAFYRWRDGTLDLPNFGGFIYWTGFFGTKGFGFGVGQEGCVGYGAIAFMNNSIYEGDLMAGAEWNCVRYGWGWNKWTVDEKAGWINGADGAWSIIGFEGEFDCVDHAWIWGNGTWYFQDGETVRYITGNWDGGTRLGDATRALRLRPEYANAVQVVL